MNVLEFGCMWVYYFDVELAVSKNVKRKGFGHVGY